MRYLLWDFDGTLAYCEGRWSGAFLAVLDAAMPGHAFGLEDVRRHLRGGFPWHSPEVPHPHLCSAEAWWGEIEPRFARVLGDLGVAADRTTELARQVHLTYCAVARWRLFEDTLPVLAELSARGWQHLILSNHVPELGGIVAQLPLGQHIRAVSSSAETGYEKPHPEAFRSVLASIPDAAAIWMIGDNMEADIVGAARAGIPGVLVRNAHPDARLCCADLWELLALLDP